MSHVAKYRVRSNRMSVRALARILSLLLASLPVSSGASVEEIYVRLNSNPFAAPFYVFSSTENGASMEIELLKGSSYVFIRTDSGHPFNIGSSWRTAHPELISNSTGTSSAVSGIASIERGERLSITIPDNFSGSRLAYYCYPHSSMVASFSVKAPTGGLDTDSDGIPDSTDTDDDGDGVLDNTEAANGTDPLDYDTDNDGVSDGSDVFPLNEYESVDTDSDGIGNNTDSDDDGDGLTDTQEANYGTDPLLQDSDSDGFSDYEEIIEGTDPLDANSAPMGGLSLILIKAFLDKQKSAQ